MFGLQNYFQALKKAKAPDLKDWVNRLDESMLSRLKRSKNINSLNN